jgi:hypothetical protein
MKNRSFIPFLLLFLLSFSQGLEARAKFLLASEMGFGNILSLYAGADLKFACAGLGFGFTKFSDQDYQTSISILEPNLFISRVFGAYGLRLRVGKDFLFEKRYALERTAVFISPEFFLIKKGFYAGLGFPILIARTEAGFAPTIGVGYEFSF